LRSDCRRASRRCALAAAISRCLRLGVDTLNSRARHLAVLLVEVMPALGHHRRADLGRSFDRDSGSGQDRRRATAVV
jgi:hypothetical protein